MYDSRRSGDVSMFGYDSEPIDESECDGSCHCELGYWCTSCQKEMAKYGKRKWPSIPYYVNVECIGDRTMSIISADQACEDWYESTDAETRRREIECDAETRRQEVEFEDTLTWHDRAIMIDRLGDYSDAVRWGELAAKTAISPGPWTSGDAGKYMQLAVRHALVIMGERHQAYDEGPVDVGDYDGPNAMLTHWPSTLTAVAF